MTAKSIAQAVRKTFSSDTTRIVRPILVILLSLPLLVALTACPHRGVDPLKPRNTSGQKAPASEEGYSYIVKKGETLEEIARAHHTALRELADANRLKPPYAIKAGMRLIIPKTGTGGQTSTVPDNPTGKAVGKAGRGSLEWPVKGRVVVEFGEGKAPEENGIVIEGPEGTVVRAAAAGKVGHVGKLAALGNVVLLEHPNHLVTVYAHLKNVRASKGKPVAKGEILGTVGTSGRVEKPSLYFEVRSRSKPKDPLLFLGQSRQIMLAPAIRVVSPYRKGATSPYRAQCHERAEFVPY